MKSLAKKLAAVATVVLTANAAMASESYLYWMINEAEGNDGVIAFNYATISMDNGSSYLSWYVGSEEVNTKVYVWDYEGASTLGYGTGRVFSYLNSDPSDTTTFLVELWGEEEGTEKVLGTQKLTYDTVKNYIYSGTGRSGATPYVITGDFTAVPEPTSGLLMLLGVAALSLRRKRL